MKGGAFEANDDVRLFETTLQALLAAEIARRQGGFRRRDGQQRESLGHRLGNLAMIDRAGRADDHAAGAITVGKIGRDALAIEGAHMLARAEDGPADRLIRKRRLAEE